MENYNNWDEGQGQYSRTPLQSDNNSGTLGQEGGLNEQEETHSFKIPEDPEKLETGDEEYNRHHQDEQVHEPVRAVGTDEQEELDRIDMELPGNQPNNEMTSHAENYGGISAED